MTRASTPGSVRNTAGTLSPRGKLGLHARAHSGNDFAGLVPDGLGARGARVGLKKPAHRLFRQSRPEFFEVAGRESLTAQGRRPLTRQLLDEPVTLGGEPPSVTGASRGWRV